MKVSQVLFCVVCFFLNYNWSLAQPDHKNNAEIYFESGRYQDALDAYNAYDQTENDPQLIIKRGLCCLYTNQPDACIRNMVAAEKLRSTDNKRYKYIANALMLKKEYAEAAKYYKIYLNTLKKENPEWQTIITEIRRCGFSANYKYQPNLAFVENLGSGVNTNFDEFGAVQSPTRPERYYFSSAREDATGGLINKDGLPDVLRGHYTSDMYMIDLIDGKWGRVFAFGKLLNSPKHEILQDFSPDGSVVYFIKSSDKINGNLFTDTFHLEKEPDKISFTKNFPFKAEKGDKDLCIFSDSLIIFASNQAGGYGGYDLYYAERKDAKWQKPLNFGPDINTSANEISPYMVRSGSAVYFSSDRPDTYGGYDIFVASLTDDGSNSNVLNVGYPINSPGNDTDIELSFDGVFALFSSDRIEGYGGQDLYIAYFKDQVTDQLQSTENPPYLSKNNKPEIPDLPAQVSNTVKTLPHRDYVAKPLYFAQDEDLMNATNQNSLKSLAEIMQIYPDIRIDLYSHFLFDGNKEFDLYYSVKRAEKIAEYLIKSGISSRRILLFGCGANYPLALQYVNGIPSTLAKRTNNRIDIKIHQEKNKNLNVMYDFPVVAVQNRDTLWDNFHDRNQQLTFRVAFSKVGQMLKNDVFSLSNDVIIEKRASDNLYTYTIGNYSTYVDASKMKSYLLASNFEKSEIVPYLKGSPVDKVDMISLSKEYPEIVVYLNESSK